MKTITKAILFIGLCLPAGLFAQWDLILNHADREAKLALVDEQTIVAITYDDGRIHRSANQGEHWSLQETELGLGEFMFDVQFPNPEVGYICGGTYFGVNKSFILKSNNGGESWNILGTNMFDDYMLSDMFFVNADTGIVVGDGWNLYRTYDGGQSFDTLKMGFRVFDIVFTENNTGYIPYKKYVSSKYYFGILKTTDFGETWSTVYEQPVGEGLYGLNELFFLNESVGFAVGDGGLFLKTKDGGVSWQQQLIAPNNNLTAVFFTSEDVGYINNAGGIYKTIDGGENWKVQQVNPAGVIEKIYFLNDSIGYAVGDKGIFKTSNAGEHLGLGAGMPEMDVLMYPNPATSEIYIKTGDRALSQLDIYDITGKLMLRQAENLDKIDVSKLENGSYLVVIISPYSRATKMLVVGR